MMLRAASPAACAALASALAVPTAKCPHIVASCPLGPIGRRNWLFAGSERAGKRAAAIQSLLGTAKLNGIEPCAWLQDVLEKLPTWPNSRIDELLPLRSTVSPLP